MKNIPKVEKILILIVVISIIGMLAKISGFVAFTVLSLSFLSLVYLIFGFAILNGVEIKDAFYKKSFEKIKSSNVVAGVLLGIWVFSISAIAIQFTLMEWKGADKMRFIALISLAITLLIYGLIYIKTKNSNVQSILFRVLFYIVIVLILYVR